VFQTRLLLLEDVISGDEKTLGDGREFREYIEKIIYLLVLLVV
jgi:hypothetical protein